MHEEIERLRFEAWNLENFGSIDLTRFDNGEYRSARTRSDWELWQAASAVGTSAAPEASGLTFEDMAVAMDVAAKENSPYVSAMGEAAEHYHGSFPYAYPLPALWRWSEVWDLMCEARTDA